ncbi:peptide deformylase [Arcobacter sp. 31_11_sub10_T18]|nr:peptide deformylase [Arcobacter sp. 31_11_sub10_T18]
MIKEIITYPNKLLRTKSKDVEKFDSELHTLLDDLYETMVAKDGVGLAAIQISIPLNVLIICIPDENNQQLHENALEAINPVITHKDGVIVFTEGCLSVPDVHEEIKRSQSVTVDYFDRHGEKHTMETEEFLAVVWQHELDHLEGHLFIEKLSVLKRKKFEKEWKKKLKEAKNNK